MEYTSWGFFFIEDKDETCDTTYNGYGSYQLHVLGIRGYKSLRLEITRVRSDKG
jgi:hypothetical protein